MNIISYDPTASDTSTKVLNMDYMKNGNVCMHMFVHDDIIHGQNDWDGSSSGAWSGWSNK